MLEISYILAVEATGLVSKFDSSQYKIGKQFNSSQCKGMQKIGQFIILIR